MNIAFSTCKKEIKQFDYALISVKSFEQSTNVDDFKICFFMLLIPIKIKTKYCNNLCAYQKMIQIRCDIFILIFEFYTFFYRKDESQSSQIS
jgi:hypothetical protein